MSNEVKPPLKSAPLKAAPAPAPKPEPVYVSLQERKAFTVERAPGGWCFVTVTYTDDGVIKSIEKSQPDLKPIIIERFKISALKYWTSVVG